MGQGNGQSAASSVHLEGRNLIKLLGNIRFRGHRYFKMEMRFVLSSGNNLRGDGMLLWGYGDARSGTAVIDGCVVVADKEYHQSIRVP